MRRNSSAEAIIINIINVRMIVNIGSLVKTLPDIIISSFFFDVQRAHSRIMQKYVKIWKTACSLRCCILLQKSFNKRNKNCDTARVILLLRQLRTMKIIWKIKMHRYPGNNIFFYEKYNVIFYKNSLLNRDKIEEQIRKRTGKSLFSHVQFLVRNFPHFS